MKVLSAIVLIFISNILLYSKYSSHDYWVRQPTPTFARLDKCIFTDTLNGWACGDSGIMIHTSNGGLTWVRQNTGVTYTFYSISFPNPRHGWAIANNFVPPFARVLHTTNGGLNWSITIYPDSNLILAAIYFLDSLNGWMGGQGGTFLQTTNSGQNWISRLRDSTNRSGYPVLNFAFYSPFFGFGCGGVNDFGGVVWRTTNSGMFWRTNDFASVPVRDLFFIDSLHIIGAGGEFDIGGAFFKSSDGGLTWTDTTTGLFGVAWAVAYRNAAEIWLPHSGAWVVSFDSARTWQPNPVPDSSVILDAMFVDESHGWVCGDHGLIAKYQPNPIGIQNQQNNFPMSDILFQNYPNPFNPYTVIEFYLIRLSFARIIIYDLLGREVHTILNGPLKAGNHKLKFFGENLPSGVYFYRLETANFSETKKMVIMK